mgnify:CR=1 FL=1
MGRVQKNDNFIDKTFTIVADILLKVFPASKQEKQAFSYYRDGMSAQSEGEYAEALENYYEALQIEEDPYDRSYILYNVGLIYSSNGKYLMIFIMVRFPYFGKLPPLKGDRCHRVKTTVRTNKRTAHRSATVTPVIKRTGTKGGDTY